MQDKQESQLFNSENYCSLHAPCLANQKFCPPHLGRGEHHIRFTKRTVAGLTNDLCEINVMQDLFLGEQLAVPGQEMLISEEVTPSQIPWIDGRVTGKALPSGPHHCP